ncbi:FAD synthase-like isoform X1 [Schistocerca serialis cubense]|uniref:FAD synthase-like isoform X1 n=1 Tax=Schistocerca serialis cubense TaxID=2023355 RepID=UPI00214E0C41|nr:FAD synthase-like isoform X1 [Schistocerca serialis cubense]
MARSLLYLENMKRSLSLKHVIYSCRNLCSKKMKEMKPTAGIVIIGDEVLKGQTLDTNSHFIAKKLFDIGVKVKKILVVGDDIDAVANEIKALSGEFTYIITTGGIGPTHDDITFEAIAKAFNETTYPHPKLIDICKKFFKTSDDTAPGMKLAHVPKSAKLNFGFDELRGRHTLYPCVSVNNVYIFPGVPELLERLFTILYKDLFGSKNKHAHVKELYLSANEVAVTEKLNQAVKLFPMVSFGSYPKFYHSYYSLLVTVESDVEKDAEEAYNMLKSLLGEDIVVSYDKCPLDETYRKIEQAVARGDMATVREAFRYVASLCQKYKPEEVCLYLDGSKAATALLHMLYACMKEAHFAARVEAIYAEGEKSNVEVMKFIRESAKRYDSNFQVLNGDFNKAMKSHISKHKGLKILVVGYSVEDDMQYPRASFESLHGIDISAPLQSCTSSEIWSFIRSLYIPYCGLYDRGYPTIRSMMEEVHLTSQEPERSHDDGKNIHQYKPTKTSLEP